MGGGYEWIAGGVDNRIYRYQWRSLNSLEPIDLPRMRGSPVAGEGPSEIGQVAVHERGLRNRPGHRLAADYRRLQHIDARLKRVYRLPIRSRQIGDIEAGSAGVWMENRIERFTGEERAALASAFPHLVPLLYVLQGECLQQGVAVAPPSVWFAPGKGQTVIDLDPATNECTAGHTRRPGHRGVGGRRRDLGRRVSPRGNFQARSRENAVSLTVHMPRTSAAYITGLAVGPNRVWALIQDSRIKPGWPCPTQTCYLP